MADATPQLDVFFESRRYISLYRFLSKSPVTTYVQSILTSVAADPPRKSGLPVRTDGVSLSCCRADRRGTQTVCSPADTANCSDSSRRGGTWSPWSGSGSGRWPLAVSGLSCSHRDKGWGGFCFFFLLTFLIGCDNRGNIYSGMRVADNWEGCMSRAAQLQVPMNFRFHESAKFIFLLVNWQISHAILNEAYIIRQACFDPLINLFIL